MITILGIVGPGNLFCTKSRPLKQKNMVTRRVATVLLAGLVVLASSLFLPAQTPQRNKTTRIGNEAKNEPPPSHLSESQLPAFAISLVTSLAHDARSYSDLALRPRVLARAADVLWDADNVTARELFKRAWEAAEKGDAEEVTIKKDNPPAMAMALRRMSGRDLRLEVLSVIARRDRTLSEEYLAKLKKAGEESQTKEVANDHWFVSDAVSKRLHVASALLADGQTEHALEFAAPALNQVNVHSIGFLSALRAKNANAADRRFAMLLASAELDPAADANTVSGLSSYIFTPGLYVTFQPEGSMRWTEPDEPLLPSTNFPVSLREKFLQVAANILLRPLPPLDPTSASSPRNTKAGVIKRLLPLFEQYAPDTAAALRAQLVELASGSSRNMPAADHFMLNQGIKPELSADQELEQLRTRIDRTKTSRERDQIYAAAVSVLLAQGDERARDVAEKIEDSERRTEIRQFVDFEFIQRAIRKKASTEAIRLAKTGKLSNTQRASAYIGVARLVREAEPQRAADLLEDAVREVRRIEGDKPDRALLLVGVASLLIAADRVRAWEIIDEAGKEANRLEGFTGENAITFPLMTRSSVKFISIGGEDFSLSNAFRLLAKDDLYRALDLAKSFKYDAPRATATLAIASSILEKPKDRITGWTR